ncbi:MAG: DMT family transporter [Pseudomonadota bacterium]
MSANQPSPISGALLGALTILCWSGYNVAAKAGIDAGLSPAALSFLRYLTPTLFAVPAYIWLRRRTGSERPPLIRLLALAILGGPFFGLIAVAGYQYAPLSHGLLIAPVAVFLTGMAWGAILLKEKITAPRVFGATVMFGGLVLLVGIESDGGGGEWLLGAALFVAAGFMWGAYTALLRHWRIPVLEGAVAVALISAVFAAAAIGPWAIASLASAEPRMVAIQIATQGLLGGVLSVVALIAALRTLKAQTAAMLPTFTPAVAMLIAWPALGAQPTLAEIVGAVIIFVGFALAACPKLALPRFV